MAYKRQPGHGDQVSAAGLLHSQNKPGKPAESKSKVQQKKSELILNRAASLAGWKLASLRQVGKDYEAQRLLIRLGMICQSKLVDRKACQVTLWVYEAFRGSEEIPEALQHRVDAGIESWQQEAERYRRTCDGHWPRARLDGLLMLLAWFHASQDHASEFLAAITGTYLSGAADDANFWVVELRDAMAVCPDCPSNETLLETYRGQFDRLRAEWLAATD